MQFTHLTTQSDTQHCLTSAGQYVFFLHNQSGNFSFELNAPGIEVSIFALFTADADADYALTVNQIHNAPKSTSHVHVAYLGKDNSALRYEGLIRIAPEATQSIASQKNNNLLISDTASAFSFPSLEILTDDVICHHGSTTARINKDHLFYAQTRGIDPLSAQAMLAEGFVESFFGMIEKLGEWEEVAACKKLISP